MSYNYHRRKFHRERRAEYLAASPDRRAELRKTAADAKRAARSKANDPHSERAGQRLFDLETAILGIVGRETVSLEDLKAELRLRDFISPSAIAYTLKDGATPGPFGVWDTLWEIKDGCIEVCPGVLGRRGFEEPIEAPDVDPEADEPGASLGHYEPPKTLF